MENLPVFTSLFFVMATGLAVYMIYRASRNSKVVLLLILAWLVLQAVLSLSGFYQLSGTVPPRVILLILPPTLLCLILFLLPRGKRFIDRLNPATLTLLHIVRIPVEITLYLLFLEKQVPRLMTFAGGNYDIFSGLTAPVIYYFGFIKNRLPKEIILTWNFICLGLLLSIIYHALLSAPSPIKRFAFDQPNLAIRDFPYAWLPSCIVPLVLFSHLAVIRQLRFIKFADLKIWKFED